MRRLENFAKQLPLGCLAWWLCFAEFSGMAEALASSRPKKPKSTIFIVRSNAAQAQISSDGIIRGKVGQAFEVEPGVVDVSIEARGYVKRTFLFEAIAGKENSVKINLIRQFKNAKTQAINLSDSEEPEALLNEASLCLRLDATMANRSGDQLLTCRLRKTWLDELRFAGFDEEGFGVPSIFFQPAQRDQFAKLQKKLSEGLPDATWLRSAALLRAEVPDFPPVASLEAWGYLMRGQCRRVGEIWQDAMANGAGEPISYLVQEALCKELLGNREEALQSLRKPIQTKAGAPSLMPFYYFHLARLEMNEWLAASSSQTQLERKRSAQQFEPILARCLKDFPRYYPCLDLYRLSLLVQEKRAELKNMYLKLFGLPTMQPLKLLNSSLRSQLSARDFQFLWESLKQDYADDRDVQLAYYVQTKREGRPINLDQAVDSIENAKEADYTLSLTLTRNLLEEKEVALATRLFQWLLREDPKRDHVRWHLISLARARKDFQTCADLGQEVPLSFSNDIVVSFRKLQGDCLLRLKAYQEAGALFESLLHESGTDWSIGYHAALAYDKLGDSRRLEAAIQAALAKDPPSQFRIKMQKLLDRHSSVKAK